MNGTNTLKFLAEQDLVTRAMIGRMLVILADSVCEPSVLRVSERFRIDGRGFAVTIERHPDWDLPR